MRQLMVWIATFSTVAAMVCFLASEASAAVIDTTLLHAAHGTSTTTGTVDLDTFAVTGLGATDVLHIEMTTDCVSCTGSNTMSVRNGTDNVAMFIGTTTNLGSADFVCHANQQATTSVRCDGRSINTVGGATSTFTTAWTGSWNLVLRGQALTGGTRGWNWKVWIEHDVTTPWPASAAGYLHDDGAGVLTWGTPSGTLPADANGFLYNDGTGTKSWSWLMPPNNCTAVNVNSDEWAPCDPVTSLDVMAFGVIVIAWAIFALAIVWRTRRRS